MDGHVERLTAEKLVAGWDWKRNKVTDYDSYLWDTY
jgi:hypothetical protein